jgi:hypothetical protein
MNKEGRRWEAMKMRMEKTKKILFVTQKSRRQSFASSSGLLLLDEMKINGDVG